jgi:ParB family transcriptional regulator, chromosome partitioning protein
LLATCVNIVQMLISVQHPRIDRIMTETLSETAEKLMEVSLDMIEVNRFQPRRHFSAEELHELAQSIKSVGLIHPPTVRPVEGKDTYELISGERRYRAAQLAGLKNIKVVVRSATSMASAQAALVENIQRVDLNPIEIAKAFRQLIDQFGLNQENLAETTGKKRSTIANYLRLLALPKHIQEAIEQDKITMGHAKAILSLDGYDKQNLLYEIVLRDNLNVRDTEEAAGRLSEKAQKKELVYVQRDIYLEHLNDKIQQKLGTKTTIQGSEKQGRITIHYYNLDDLDRLLQLLGVVQE